MLFPGYQLKIIRAQLLWPIIQQDKTHSPQNLPANCVYGKFNSTEHALSFSNGTFPTIRHNDIWDLTADLLSEVCHDVSTEPSLQPLTGEPLSLCTANCGAGDCLDIKASGFWGFRLERAQWKHHCRLQTVNQQLYLTHMPPLTVPTLPPT